MSPLNKNPNFEAYINQNRMSNATFEKVLGITSDNRLSFNHHISNICKTAGNKLHALAKFHTSYLSLITVL